MRKNTNFNNGSYSSEYDSNNVKALMNKNYNKSNDIIQHYRYNLPPYENKVLTYIVSHIDWADKDVSGITIDINEFHALCDLAAPSGGKDFNNFFNALEYLRTSKITVMDDSSIEWFSWLDKISINMKNFVYTVYLHEDVKPYFVDMQNVFARTGNGYTSCSVSAIMRMKGLYSPRLYELLKSYLNLGKWAVSVEDLRKLLTPKEPDRPRGSKKSRKAGRRATNLNESYKDFKDFNKRVLKPAIAEINELSDIYIDEDFQKIRNHEKKVEKIIFTMHRKSDEEVRKIETQVNKKVEEARIRKSRQIPDDIKKQLLLSLDAYDGEDVFVESIVLNEGLSENEVSKRYNLLKAVNGRLGTNFSDIFTGEAKDNFEEVHGIFIDMLWADIKEMGADSPALSKFNEIIRDASLLEFYKKIIVTYGCEAFWQNVERNGKVIKYRKKYLKVTLYNTLMDWSGFMQKPDTNPYSQNIAVADKDVVVDEMHNVPVFKIN